MDASINLSVKHCLDPILNKPLIVDTLLLLEDMGHTEAILYKALNCRLNEQIQPFTDLELYKLSMAYIKAPMEDMDALIRYATHKRIERDKAEELESLKHYVHSLDSYLKSIDRTIARLKEEIQSLEYKAKNIKGIQYDKQRLENVKDLSNTRLTSYISKKDDLKATIKEYERLKKRLKETANQPDRYGLDLKEAYERL